jgi:ribose transport system permease protein
MLRLQSFLVTLCGMFVFRGLAREISSKQPGRVSVLEAHPEFTDTFNTMRAWLVGKAENGELEFPAQFAIMLALMGLASIFLHKSAYGRFWYAIGYNEQAARYAGLNVLRHRNAIFVICSVLAAFAGVLLFFFAGTVDPTTAGTSFELYAITAAVLGGVSLKGGEGTAFGLMLGALIQPLINNMLTFLEVDSRSEPWLIGLILLLGTMTDELIRRRSRASR